MLVNKLTKDQAEAIKEIFEEYEVHTSNDVDDLEENGYDMSQILLDIQTKVFDGKDIFTDEDYKNDEFNTLQDLYRMINDMEIAEERKNRMNYGGFIIN